MADLPKSTLSSQKKTRKKPEPKPIYPCICCGRDRKIDEYHKSASSRIWRLTEGRVLICRECLDNLLRELTDRWGERMAVGIICHYLDMPFDVTAYMAIINKYSRFELGPYIKSLNCPQLKYSSFVNSLVTGEFAKDISVVQEDVEAKWNREDQRNKNTVVEVIGYDPFDGYTPNARKFLFGEIIKYFDDDISEDSYKLSVLIQLVVNSYQINQYNLEISKLSPVKNPEEIKNLQVLKQKCSDINTKLAQDNEISVKNRSNKDVGKSTLTFLMRDLREKDFKTAEANYYDALRGEGSLWAIDMSNRAILQNAMFDENDKQEIFLEQRKMIQSLQAKLDDALEENRLLKIAASETTPRSKR